MNENKMNGFRVHAPSSRQTNSAHDGGDPSQYSVLFSSLPQANCPKDLPPFLADDAKSMTETIGY
jgi:hypothetical protein